MITYNHEKFITQALDGILMQKTTFDFEVIIGEDLSSDNTRNIIEDYVARYGDKIRLIDRCTNVGPKNNFIETYRECRGEYIAMLDGDDYWSSPNKLQRQVDFLDQNKTFSICYHAVQMVDGDGVERMILPVSKYRERNVATLEDLVISESFMATCSTMFRNRLFDTFPGWFYEFRNIVDLPLNILNAQHGDIGYINEVMAVYRSNSGPGAFSAKPRTEINMEAIVMFEGINKHLNFEYNAVLQEKIARNYFQIAQDNLASGKLKEAKLAFIKTLRKRPSCLYIKRLDLLRMAATIYLPFFVSWLRMIKKISANIFA